MKEKEEQEEREEKTVREGPAVEMVGSGTVQLPPGVTVGGRTPRKASLGRGLGCVPHHVPQLMGAPFKAC